LKKILFHKNFKLQGKSFNSCAELISFSETINKDIKLFLELWFNTNTFIEVQTSGSTGKPKAIQLKKEFMVNSAKATGNYFNLPKKTTALLCMPVNYIAGKMMLVRALTLGWSIDVVAPTANPLSNSTKEYDFLAMIPLQLHNSLKEIHKVKKLIIGGGAVSNALLTEIKYSKTKIFATYGMTETITHIAVKKLNNFENGIASETKQSHYKTLPNILISKDKRGCLVINAPKISSKKIITNDLVTIISEKEFEWLGRLDTIINSGGIKLIPEQIEKKLAKIITERFFVAGIPNKILGEKLVLVIEKLITEQSQSKNKNTLKSTSLNYQIKEIFAKIKDLKLLSRFEIPKEIYFVKQFSETETRKINRKETLQLVKK